ncbi:MAG: S-layer homology domain-containing protein [Clostridiaceae bacterium]|nr:S-layer homology domain-containing protein [Clostridiaceae bacterium]
MAKVFINALDTESQSDLLDFDAADKIDAKFLPYVSTAVELGVIQGYPSDNLSVLMTILLEQKHQSYLLY